MSTEQVLIYAAVGLGIFNLCLPLLRVIARKTETKVDDTLVQALEDGLRIAREIQSAAAKKKEGEK